MIRIFLLNEVDALIKALEIAIQKLFYKPLRFLDCYPGIATVL
jgi:hypothetical protein